jgi:hypothetical protein
VERESNQMTGRDIQARRSSVGAQQREALRALQGQAF